MPETVFFWIYDHPQLLQRFRDILARKMVELTKSCARFSGTPDAGLVDHG